MSRPLPRRVRFKERETALSLALRLAQRHGECWQGFSTATGLPNAPLRLSEDLDRLAALSGVDRARIEPWTPRWHGRDMEVLGHRMARARFLRSNLRLCPACMLEDVDGRSGGERAEDAPYLRLEWCLAFVFGCARHSVRLVTRCPSCGERPKCSIGRIDACHCGRSLLGVEPEELTKDEAGLLAALEDRLYGRSASNDLLTAIDGVPLADVVNLLQMLGMAAEGREGVHAKAAMLDVDDLPRLLLHGVNAVADLPLSYEELLDGIIRSRPRSGSGTVGAYGLPIVRWMRSDRPFVEVLRPVFDDHSVRQGIVPAPSDDARPRSSASRIALRGRVFLTMEETRRLQEAVGWDGAVPPTREEVLTSLKGGGGVLGFLKTAKYLGVRVGILAALRHRGFVRPIWVGPGAGLSQFFYRSELDDLVARLRGAAPELDTLPQGGILLADGCRGRGRTADLMVSDVLERRIACLGFIAGRPGVRGLVVRVADLPRATRVRPGLVTQKAICAALQMSPTEVLAARELGLLDIVEDVNGIKPSTEASVARFAGCYVSLCRIAKSAGMPREAVLRRLRSGGIVRRGPAGLIHRREDIEHLFPGVSL